MTHVNAERLNFIHRPSISQSMGRSAHMSFYSSQPLLHSYPVCLSPMINSRWPLPIGTKLSTALMPVCMGSFTEIRGMIPGALRPTRLLVLDVIAPYNMIETIHNFTFGSHIIDEIATSQSLKGHTFFTAKSSHL